MHGDAERQSYLWEQSYAALLAVLERHGTSSATGKGDFWLLDDNYGGPEHLLTIFWLEALTASLLGELQSVLRAPALDGWTIRVALDLPGADGASTPPEGLILGAQAVEEHWDRQALQARFGDAFHFPAGWQAQARHADLAPPDIPATPTAEFHAEWMADEAQWLREHEELVALMEAHTGQAASPDAVFHVPDEERAGPHTLVLQDIGVLTRALTDRLSALLRSPHWTTQTIMVALALRAPDGEWLPPQGLLVHRDTVDPLWDAALLKQLFGDRFGWSDPPASPG